MKIKDEIFMFILIPEIFYYDIYIYFIYIFFILTNKIETPISMTLNQSVRLLTSRAASIDQISLARFKLSVHVSHACIALSLRG